MAIVAPEDKTSNKGMGHERKRDREKTRQEILDVAFHEFAENGLSGANTDVIAARAGITKRLIFYYFRTKEELFTAVLESVYQKMRIAEEDLGLDAMTPEQAIRTLVEFTFDFDHANVEFVRLVTIENIHRGRHLELSLRAKEMTRPIIAQIERLLQRGHRLGAFRGNIDPVELHMTISALCFFSVANRHTFEPQFSYDMSSSEALVLRKKQLVELVWRYVRAM